MTEAIEPLMTALQSEAASPLATTTGATATLSIGIATFTVGYTERGIDSVTTGTTAEDGGLFVNGLALTVLPGTLAVLVLVVVFAA